MINIKGGFSSLKHIGISEKYKYVYKYKRLAERDIIFKTRIGRCNWQNYYLTEREAGIAVDVKLIENGLDPVNVLKKKLC